MEVKVIDTNMYCNKAIAIAMTDAVENIFSNGYNNEEEYTYESDMYNCEDEDAFSDVDYDSDACDANLSKRRYDDDSEDEIWEDEKEEEDEEISNAIRLQMLREKSKKQLEGLSILEGKLNWLEKVPVVESDIDNDEYPVLGAIVKPALKKKSPSRDAHYKKYVPAMIPVRVSNKTYIEFELVICKAIREGKTCVYGDKCKFSHDLPKSKIDYSTRLCNFIRNGEECKFEGRCKFSHDIKLLKRKRSGDKKATEQKAPKAMCRNGLKCENRKCTFTHPPGHKKAPVTPTVLRPANEQPQRVANKSPVKTKTAKTRTPNSSPSQAPLDIVDKKFLLCKNIFKVERGVINIIGECRFGAECKFAHSRNEVEKKIKDNLNEFECKHKDCKGVEVEFITKKDKDGKERKTRRYKNSAIRKCFKIHEKERVSDFIVRTQGARA
jgi:hypothetical protein